MRQAAGDGNLALHFVGFDPHDSQQQFLMAQLYFRTVYSLYPGQVFMGTGSERINNADDIVATDRVANPVWLRHNVRTCTVLGYHGADVELNIQDFPVPR